MGTALITLKIMPISPEVNLEEIKEKTKAIIENKQGKNIRFEEEPIAFGLKAVKALFDIDESIELETIEQEIEKLEKVNSVQVADMRRAFG